MNFLEKDLEQIIFEADKAELQKRGLPIYGKLFRQVRLGDYGVADLISVKKCRNGKKAPFFEVTVYELKKERISISSFLQALGYVKGIEIFLRKRRFYHKVYFNIRLVGKSIDEDSSFIYLPDFVFNNNKRFIENFIYSYDINGINFRSLCGYKLDDNRINVEEF